MKIEGWGKARIIISGSNCLVEDDNRCAHGWVPIKCNFVQQITVWTEKTKEQCEFIAKQRISSVLHAVEWETSDPNFHNGAITVVIQ